MQDAGKTKVTEIQIFQKFQEYLGEVRGRDNVDTALNSVLQTLQKEFKFQDATFQTTYPFMTSVIYNELKNKGVENDKIYVAMVNNGLPRDEVYKLIVADFAKSQKQGDAYPHARVLSEFLTPIFEAAAKDSTGKHDKYVNEAVELAVKNGFDPKFTDDTVFASDKASSLFQLCDFHPSKASAEIMQERLNEGALLSKSFASYHKLYECQTSYRYEYRKDVDTVNTLLDRVLKADKDALLAELEGLGEMFAKIDGYNYKPRDEVFTTKLNDIRRRLVAGEEKAMQEARAIIINETGLVFVAHRHNNVRAIDRIYSGEGMGGTIEAAIENGFEVNLLGNRNITVAGQIMGFIVPQNAETAVKILQIAQQHGVDLARLNSPNANLANYMALFRMLDQEPGLKQYREMFKDIVKPQDYKNMLWGDSDEDLAAGVQLAISFASLAFSRPATTEEMQQMKDYIRQSMLYVYKGFVEQYGLAKARELREGIIAAIADEREKSLFFSDSLAMAEGSVSELIKATNIPEDKMRLVLSIAQSEYGRAALDTDGVKAEVQSALKFVNTAQLGRMARELGYVDEVTFGKMAETLKGLASYQDDDGLMSEADMKQNDAVSEKMDYLLSAYKSNNYGVFAPVRRAFNSMFDKVHNFIYGQPKPIEQIWSAAATTIETADKKAREEEINLQDHELEAKRGRGEVDYFRAQFQQTGRTGGRSAS